MTETELDRAEIDAFLLTLPSFSRPVITQYFRSGFSVEQKADNSPVTIADKSVEAELRNAILAAFPDHAIVGEEQGGRADRQICWVIDPIDGTRAFVIGKPVFGTLVGVARDGQPFAGLIDMRHLMKLICLKANQLSHTSPKILLSVAAAASLTRHRLLPPARALPQMAWLGLTD